MCIMKHVQNHYLNNLKTKIWSENIVKHWKCAGWVLFEIRTIYRVITTVILLLKINQIYLYITFE